MNVRTKVLAFLALLIFSIGILLGLALFTSLVWADLEASMFRSTIRGDAALRGVRCPVFLTSTESGAIRARFSNPLDRSTQFAIRTFITEGLVSLMREDRQRLPLEPGESQQLEWPVKPDDAAYGRVILARVFVRGGWPLPTRHASCGILVLDVPALTGRQILALALAASLGCMGLGTGLWLAIHRPLAGLGLDVARALGALAVTVVVGIVISLLGMWVPGVLAVVVAVLLIGAIMGYFLNRYPA